MKCDLFLGLFLQDEVRAMVALLPPATKLGQGNIFTGVCDSVSREGVLPPEGGCFLTGGCFLPGGASSWGGAGGDPPSGTATAAGGTHPTRMHSCWSFVFGLTLIFDYQWFTFSLDYFTKNLPLLGCQGYGTPISVAFLGSEPRRHLGDPPLCS